MRSLKRRGRPPLKRPELDKGTKELQQKRESGLTQLPLDLCLSRGKISQREHDAASRLKWLYSLQYGVAAPSQVQWDREVRHIRERDQLWLAKRKKEYEQAVTVLEKCGVWYLVREVGIFGQYPAWLVAILEKRELSNKSYLRLRRGLCELARHWRM